VTRWVLAVALVLLATGPAAAHKPSDAYLRLAIDPGAAPHGSLDVALRDLDRVVGLDGNGDGAITWGELKARHRAFVAYVQSRLVLATPVGRCELRPLEQLVDTHTDGAYAVLRFVAECPAAPGELKLRYGLLFDVDPMHRGLLTVSRAGAVTTAVLSPAAPEIALEGAAARSAELGPFFTLGLEHIAFGFDHLLFLLVLLLPAAYRRAPGGAWLPVTDWWTATFDIVKILSAFTLAHAVSLTAATTGVVDLPTRLVESAIAATIVLTALDNVWPCLPGKRWLIAFGFGLIHGLGFASALGPLDLPPLDLAIALLGFNLGIEAGQVAVAVCVLTAVYPLRTFGLYARGLLPVGSAGALLLAAFWFVDRAFAGALTPF
jgi:HupE / UreJ protein